MRFETERLILRRVELADFDDFKVAEMDPEVMRFIRKAAATEEEAREKFNSYFSYQEAHPGYGVLSVIEKETRKFIGLGVIIHIELKPEIGKIEVGYRFNREAWGKGYATEVARGLIDYGFNVLKLAELFGTTHPDHVVSQKVLLKVGMESIGSGPYHNGSAVFRIKSPGGK